MSYVTRRLILVFVLALAIPFQGIASSLMLVCEFGHSSDLIVASHDNHSEINTHAHSDSVELNESTLSIGHNSLKLIGYNVDHDHSFSSDSHKNENKHNHCCSSVSSSVMTSMASSFINLSNNVTEFSYISSYHLPPFLGSLDRPPRATLV